MSPAVIEGEAAHVEEGFGGAPSSPDEPPAEELERAWSEVATPVKAKSSKGRAALWVALILLALGGAGAYYYLMVLNGALPL